MTLVAGLAGAAVSALDVQPALAANCGAERPCSCGDKVIQSTTLGRDIGPCAGDGLRLGANVVLDGAGHAIRGLGARGSVGLSIGAAASGARVRGLEVTGFERGVRLRGASRVELLEVDAHHNGDPVAHVGYGIDVADGASSNVIERCRVHGNADEGIHVGSYAAGNRISGCEVFDNHRENVYLLATTDTVVTGSRVHGGGSSAVFVKNSKGAVVARNRIADRPLTVRGASSGVQLVDNELSDAGILIEGYDDRKLGRVRPRRTTVRGGRVVAGGACIRVEDAEETRVDGVTLRCPKSIAVSGGSAVDLVAADVPAVGCAGEGVVRVLRAVDVKIVDRQGHPVAGARIAGPGAAEADQSGRLRTEVVQETTTCPGAKVEKASGLTVTFGGRSKEIRFDELGHDLILPGEGAGPQQAD